MKINAITINRKITGATFDLAFVFCLFCSAVTCFIPKGANPNITMPSIIDQGFFIPNTLSINIRIQQTGPN